MTEQQYRVIADRDKGQDVHAPAQLDGDRLTWIEYVGPNVHRELVRIERPVPTTDRLDLTRDQFSNDESYYLATGRHPSLPTREQIAEAIWEALPFEVEDVILSTDADAAADAVLTLLQKGADR